MWPKVKSRESTEVIIGAVTGTLQRPDTIAVGLYRSRVLEIVAKAPR